MKKLLLASLALGTFGANAQTKKVMLEDFTGHWCQYCPNGTKGIQDLEATHGSKFLAVATHVSNGDPLEIPDGVTIKQAMNPSGGVPSGAIDRTQFSGTQVSIGINSAADQWKTQVASQVNAPAIASVSFGNPVVKSDGTYEADVYVKFTSAPTAGKPINIQVYILESKIPAEVANGLKQTNSTTHWGGANPITTSGKGYYHDHTLRKALGGAWGFAGVIPTNPTVGTEYKHHISFTIPATGVPAAWVKDNIDLYAFVAYNGPTNMGTDKSIMNVEKIRLKDFNPVGISDVKNTTIVATYPNPAQVKDVISTAYTINESANVTFKIYNVTGQLVATPMNNSPEVAGSHTFQWSASELSLAPGTYITELSTPAGKSTQKVVIQ